MATQTSRSMISETSICNQALSWLGATQIESLEEPTRAAEYCRNNYPFLRDAVIEARMWSFARVRAVSTVADAPAGWSNDLYAHSLPADWLQVFYVFRTAKAHEQVKWTLEGGSVLADQTTVYLMGVRRITDTGKFSNLFVQTLASRLASDLAIPLAGSRELQSDMWSLYNLKLEEAAARDGQQGLNETITQTRLTDVRFNNGSLIGVR